jgi:ribA/ribD-fused uncharacterized protein
MAPETQSPLFFWRETEQPYGFLCQWFLSPFQEGNITFSTAEHYMMYHEILATKSPAEAKFLARTVNMSRDKGKLWEKQKYAIVERGNLFKFTQNEELGRRLMETGDRELVEASPNDRVWGVGFPAEFAEENRSAWGMNLLGSALTSVRERLRYSREEEKFENL